MFRAGCAVGARRWRNHSAFLLLAALLAALGGCGWAEWPPPDSHFDRSRRAPSPNQGQNQAPPPAPAPAAVPVKSVTVEATPIPAPSAGSVVASAPTDSPDKAPAAAVATARPATVTVERGETIYALARRYRVTPRAIIEANRFKPPFHLQAGQRVAIPQGRDHTVARGETLYGVAQRYTIDPYRLARANGLEPPYALRVGEQLIVPSADEAGVEVAATAPPGGAMITPPSAPGQLSAAVEPPAAIAQPQAEPVPRTGKGFGWPVRGKVLSGFGSKAKGLRNDGINIAAPAGAPVRAAEGGIVAYAGNELRGFGNLILVRHADGYVTAYAHNDSLLVKRGDPVRRGQVIARVGATGSVGRPQLHFEIRRGRKAVDPMPYLEAGSPARTG